MSMNHRPRALRPGPECAEFAPLLALVGQEDVDDHDTNDLRQHLATCAYCQRELQGYHALDAMLGRHFGVPGRPPLSRDDIAYIMREEYRPASDAADVQEEPEAQYHQRPRRGEYAAPSERGSIPPQRRLSPRIERSKRSRKLLSIFSAVAALLVISLVTVALFASHNGSTPVEQHPTPALSATSGPQPYRAQGGEELNGISMLSPTDGWIVGSRLVVTPGSSKAPATLILHYVNGQWVQVPSPTGEDLHTQDLNLNQVAMVSASEGWAVGSYVPGINQNAGLILHYINGRWVTQTVMNVVLESIFMRSATDGWIGGNVGCCGPNAGQALLLHYDGTTWNRVTAPGFDVSQIVMTSASEGWAVGSSQVNGFDGPLGTLLHYNGGKWSGVKVAGIEEVLALSLPTANDGWLVGRHFLNSRATNALSTSAGIPSQIILAHYNGKSWVIVNTEVSTYQNAFLNSISLSSPTDGWAVGDYSTNNGTATPLYYHFSDGTWKRVDGPGPDQITHVFALSASDAWATGDDGSILHYQNGKWEYLSSGNFPATPTTQTTNGTPVPTPCPSSSGPSLQPPGPGTPVPTIPFTGWGTYVNTKYHFSINYPLGWDADNLNCPEALGLILFNYHPGQNNSPGFPAGGIKIELDVRDNASGLTAVDFWNQEMQADQQGVGGPACPSFTTRQLQVAGRSAVEGGCPSLRWDSYYVPDGKYMLVITESTAPGIQPSDMLTQMVNSLAFTS